MGSPGQNRGVQGENPLPPCAHEGACELRTFYFDVPAAALYTLAREAVQSLDPVATEEVADKRLTSVHPVVVFKDDLDVHVQESGEGALIHLRSASRVGRYDFGVNARRIRNLMRALNELVVAYRLEHLTPDRSASPG